MSYTFTRWGSRSDEYSGAGLVNRHERDDFIVDCCGEVEALVRKQNTEVQVKAKHVGRKDSGVLLAKAVEANGCTSGQRQRVRERSFTCE